MRGRTRCLLVILAVAVAVTLAWVGDGWAQGILGTKHNLSTTVPTGGRPADQTIYLTAGTTEVCVFCHTPHGADTNVSAPLWNRAVNTTGYTMYSSPTFDANIDAQPTGVSQACLSCHDGTIAFDALRNLPGPGGFTDTPNKAGVTTWTFAGTTDKKMPAGAVTNLGQDLTNDHPVSMDYATAKSPSSSSGSNDHATGFYDPPKNNLVLYNGKVQCGSCHDPHRSDTKTFLRVANDGSALCLSCHKKDG